MTEKKHVRNEAVNGNGKETLFGIGDILVRIQMRMRILGSVLLTNESGSGCRCGTVPKSSLTFKK